jgi:hypothetical protein
LGVHPDDCQLEVSAVKTGDGKWRLTAESVETSTRDSDGWYAFLEGYQYNRDITAPCALNYSPDGWLFPSAADALATAQIWCKELGVQPKHTDDALPINNQEPVPTAKLIVAIQQRVVSGDCSVYATFDDDTHSLLFSYYIDELSFSDEEFIGLTRKQAMDLRHKQDVAYLQS